jgi:plastocyanin
MQRSLVRLCVSVAILLALFTAFTLSRYFSATTSAHPASKVDNGIEVVAGDDDFDSAKADKGKITFDVDPDAPTSGSLASWRTGVSSLLSSDPVSPQATVDVQVGGQALVFTPATVMINVGDTVRWTWAGSGHSVTSDDNATCTPNNQYCSPSDTNCTPGSLNNSGFVYSHTFNSAGTFTYHCQAHCAFGMKGTVMVTAAPTPTPTPTPTTVQFTSATYTVMESPASVLITVSRTGDTTGTSTVDFATSDGTATQVKNYIVTSGTLTFAANATSASFTVPIIDDAYAEADQTVNLALTNPTGATLGTQNTATLTITDNGATGPDIPQTRFGASLGGGQETPPNTSPATGQGYVLLNQGETAGTASLQFKNLSSMETMAHIHGPALPGVPAGVLFSLPVTNPVTDFQFSPNASQVADLKNGLHYMNVHSSNFTNGEIRGQLLWNPTLEPAFFVRQHYLDFLSREPDTPGQNFWVSQISRNNCVTGVQCFHDNTIGVSDAFFFETEFHQTAGFVFLMYRAAYGNVQPHPLMDANNQTEANKLPSYSVFTPDRARVIGSSNLTAVQQAFANQFVARTDFTSKYSPGLSGMAFISAVLGTIQTDDGVDLTSQAGTLMTQYNNAGGGNAGRAMVMYLLALDDAINNPVNNRAFINAEYNRQFALTLYFGFLRRDPDIGGFLFWQGQINSAAVGDVPKQQALVCSFLTAGEYQVRFGPNAPRSNAECPQ